MKVDGNKRIVTEKKVAITTNKTEYVRYEVSSSVVTDYRATDGYKDMALRSATGGRVVGGVEWDAGSAPAAFYAPKKKSAFSRGLYAFVKRAFDIVSSLVFLVAFSWLYLILALVVKLGDGGKVFYCHERVGKNGKTIRIPKFRTMKKNADKLADMLTPEQLEQYKREYKIDNDPRITKVGKFLRRTSLDELPQIWSIFIGQLSVVGPRPLMRDELDEKYGKDAGKLLSVKPGLIGYWASHGRSNCTYESGERQKMELYYVDNRSAWMDTKIIFKTIAGVIRRDGAM